MSVSENFQQLIEDIKAKTGSPVFFGESDLRNGIRLVLEFTGYNKGAYSFNLKVCSSDAFSVNQVVKIAELEKKIFEVLPFNRPDVQKSNRAKLDKLEYYLVMNDDKADRESRETVNYARKFELIVKERG